MAGITQAPPDCGCGARPAVRVSTDRLLPRPWLELPFQKLPRYFEAPLRVSSEMGQPVVGGQY